MWNFCRDECSYTICWSWCVWNFLHQSSRCLFGSYIRRPLMFCGTNFISCQYCVCLFKSPIWAKVQSSTHFQKVLTHLWFQMFIIVDNKIIRYHTLKFIPPAIVNEMLHQNATSSTFKDFLPSFGEQDSTLDIILWTFHKAFQGLTSKVKNFASYILLLSRNGVTKKLPIFHCIFSVHCLWMRLQKIQR